RARGRRPAGTGEHRAQLPEPSQAGAGGPAEGGPAGASRLRAMGRRGPGGRTGGGGRADRRTARRRPPGRLLLCGRCGPGAVPAARSDPIYAQERGDEQDRREDDLAAIGLVIAGWLALVEQLAEAQPAGTIHHWPRGSTARLSLPDVAKTAAAESRAWLE